MDSHGGWAFTGSRIGLVGRRLTRRSFLQASAGTAALTLLNLRLGNAADGRVDRVEAATLSSPGSVNYRTWEDIYRQQWTWDSISKGTHLVNCWYQAHCNWNVYVKEGVVFREEQVAADPRTNGDVPDFNPRG